MLKPVATGGSERAGDVPDVPTFVESGFPELDDSTQFIGLMTRTDVADERLEAVRKAVEDCLADDKIKDQLGAEYLPEKQQSMAEIHERFEGLRTAYEPYLGAEG